MSTDRFGNPIDASVGYARGLLIRSSGDEVRRLRHAQAVTGRFVAERGMEKIGIFTGNPRYFPLQAEDLPALCEEWVGPGLFSDDLRQAAIEHLGGDGSEEAIVVNRTSAGIIATVLALADGRPVVSLVPDGDRSHASLIRGCGVAGIPLVEVEARQDSEPIIAEHKPALVVATTVTSTLARLEDDVTRATIEIGKNAGAVTFLDEAYGARLRPVLHGGAASLALGADLAITNADKAGLSGPRAGVMAGRPEPLIRVLAKASELGMEARAPIAAGALRSLQSFNPENLREEAHDGQRIADALAAQYGKDVVVRSDLGPMIDEQDVLDLLMKMAGADRTSIVPAEATAAIGMLLLRDRGVLTVNTHGQPGGRVSLRLKPTAGAIAQVGGMEKLCTALEGALRQVSDHLDDPEWIGRLIFGGKDKT